MGDGSGNTTAPAGDQGWSNVGQVVNDGCIYLGSGWVITAHHVVVTENVSSSTPVVLNGNNYYPVAGSFHQLTTDVNGSPTGADLEMFQLQTTPPDLSGLSIAGGTYDTSMAFTAIGYGWGRAADITYWDAAWNETTSSLAVYEGYKWGPNFGTKRWGTNTLTTTTIDVEPDDYGTTQFLTTTFDQNNNPNEMQAAQFDSGGGVFVQQDGVWKLAGIIVTTSDIDNSTAQNRPDGLAVYGDQTDFADLRGYSGQIQAIMGVPEPSA